MKEKRSKRPQKWHLCQSQLFHTDVKKQPPMADTLSFNWKRSVRMSGWVFSSVTENSFSPNFASLPSLQTRSQIFLTDPERPQPSSAGVSGLAGPTKGKEGRRPSLGLGSGLRKLRRERTAFARTRGHRPHSTHSHDLRHGFQQRRLTFWPSLPSASLPGRDFLSIIDRRPAVELVGGSHRKVSLVGQALCSLKGIQRGALSCPLVWFFFFSSARLRFARTSWLFGTTTTWSSSASSFLWLRPQRPVAMTTAPRDSLVCKLAGLLRESGEWTSGWAEAGREGLLPTF